MSDFNPPEGGAHGELLTPYHVALCMLVRAYLEPDPVVAHTRSWLSETGQHALGNLVLGLIHKADSLQKPSLAQLLATIQGAVREAGGAHTVGHTIRSELGNLSCPDSLWNFFTELVDDGLVSITGVSERRGADIHSAMGVFVRACYISFSMLPFEGVCHLFKETKAYLEGSTHSQQNAASRRLPAHDFFAHELSHAQPSYLAREVGKRAPGVMWQRLSDLEQRAPQGVGMLLRHTHAMLQHDYFAAIESLHHFFDYTGSLEAAMRAAGDRPQDSERGMLLSALLSLASVQAHMGHMGEALIALNEGVRIAQQQGDNGALAHALASLCQILSAATPPMGPTHLIPGVSPAASAHLLQLFRLLTRCLRRSVELSESHLAAYAYVALAAFRVRYLVEPAASLAGPARPIRWWDGMSETCQQAHSVVTNVVTLQQLVALTAAAPQRATASAPASAAPNPNRLATDLFSTPLSGFGSASSSNPEAAVHSVAQLGAAALLVQSAACERDGLPSAALASSLQLLTSCSDVATAEEQLLAYAQLAANAAAMQGYPAALRVLSIADSQFPYGESRKLAAVRICIAQKRAVQRKDVHHARQLAADLAGLPSMSDAVDLDLRVEAEMSSITALLAAGSYEEAAAAAQSLFSLCIKVGNQVDAARLLMLLADIFCSAGSPLGALPYILSCSHHAATLHLPSLAAEAGLKLGLVGLSLGEGAAKASRKRIFQSLPLILGRAPLGLQAQAHMAHADALLTSASTEDIRSNSSRYLKPLEEAARIFGDLEDWVSAADAHHLIALVCHTARDLGLRNAAAAHFQKFSSKAQLA